MTKKTEVLAPVHLKRMIEKYRNPYSTKTDLTPQYIIDELTQVDEAAAGWHRTGSFHCLLRYDLAPRKCILDHRFTKAIFDEMILRDPLPLHQEPGSSRARWSARSPPNPSASRRRS